MPGSEHKGGAILQQRLEQRVVVIQVVFKVCILNQHDIAGRHPQPRAYRVTLAPRAILPQNLDAGCCRKASDQLARPIG